MKYDKTLKELISLLVKSGEIIGLIISPKLLNYIREETWNLLIKKFLGLMVEWTVLMI